MERIESLLEKIVEYKSKDRTTARVSKKRTFESPEDKTQLKFMFNRLYEPLGIHLQINRESDRINVKRLETVNIDPEINSVQDAIIARVIQPDDKIETIDDWIWKIANIDKSLSDAFLKV
ncbi:hypothetical protein G6F56_013777 [Rhizopus delemar]|nr:hypothetical protein G6F56_013777 [Rhizopus delemar]